MRSFAPIWSMIVDSSVWDEPDWVCKIFLTMLVCKDADQIYRGTAYQLARQSRKTELEVMEALKKLSSPDTRRLEPQDHDGRRIQAVEDGWLILNGQKYQDLMSQEMERARWRRAQSEARRRAKAAKRSPMSPREAAFLKAEDQGLHHVSDALCQPASTPQS